MHVLSWQNLSRHLSQNLSQYLKYSKELCFILSFTCSAVAVSADLKVMPKGLGAGTITGTGINCGIDCDQAFPVGGTVSLTATPAAGSAFVGWSGDCSGAGACAVNMATAKSVRAEFRLTTPIPMLTDFTPEGIANYLMANPIVNTPAEFINALPTDFKQNWILMSRSESLQTGTAKFPRFLLPSSDARFVFSLGMATHSAYPGAHPNAVEYMQWDAVEKNFRFHEIVLDAVPVMGTVPARTRGVAADDSKCSRCHSTQNIMNTSSLLGTNGIPPGSVKVKNKPNWDSYDSWGGMLPFNRDRIYQGTVEAAAFRKIFNPWTWRTNDGFRAVIEELQLQPPGVPSVAPNDHRITRLSGGANDGMVRFGFDGASPVLIEPAPAGTATINTSYAFNGLAGVPPTSPVTQNGAFVTLHHSGTPTNDEGRGVQLFDLLAGGDNNLNQQRIADELASHKFATGSVPIDIRPIALAINKGCLSVDAASNSVIASSGPALAVNQAFFTARTGLSINDLMTDTRTRAQSLPRRKADIQKINLDRTGDIFLHESEDGVADPVPNTAWQGLIQEYGIGTSAGTSITLPRIRQEVFRRASSPGNADATVMGGIYVDRESYGYNTERVALYRYFLEPLGVSVDKWSTGVRGRSRTYTFADVFGTYTAPITDRIEASLVTNPIPGLPASTSCSDLIPAVNSTLASLPLATAVPYYTDVQRIFNKGCIECHGGLYYPPVSSHFPADYFNVSETEDLSGDSRMRRSYDTLIDNALVGATPATSYLYQRITTGGENCPYGIMPCGGPALSKTDTETIRRWITGASPYTWGDPHITTVSGQPYDFQSVGEFVLLRGMSEEIQVRQTPVQADAPLPPDAYTGLASCPSLNTAVAFRVGKHRVSYQPNINGEPDPQGLELRVDGKLQTLTASGIVLADGGRILPVAAPGGIQVEFPGGTSAVVTPLFWDHYQVWFLNIELRNVRGTDGLMGAIVPGSWLPALPDGGQFGAKPANLHDRYVQLYGKFANAWRVNDISSLFDYAAGSSTKTFTLESWPSESPKSCRLDKPMVGIAFKDPLKPLSDKEAKAHCANIIAANKRADCERDVMVTGEPAFAKAYLQTEMVSLNNKPTAPSLGYPKDNEVNLASSISFSWKPSSDKDSDAISYKHCLWMAGEKLTFNSCKAADNLAFTASGLKSGKAYYWKVIAEDGKGGTTDSQTRRFATK